MRSVFFPPLAPNAQARSLMRSPPLCQRQTLACIQSPDAGCAKLSEEQPPQFLNANGKFKGFESVWEAAMCQHAALSIKVTL